MILETFRDNEFILRWGSLPISQLMSGVMAVVGVAIIITTVILNNKTRKGIEVGKPNI